MSNFVTKPVDSLICNPFETIGKEWLLITATNENKTNTMTASWGGVGILFGKPVAYLFIRPQRYTKELIDATSHFSLSVLPAQFKKQLSYFGTVSGRDEDKIATSGLSIATENGIPYFQDAKLVMICKKLFAQPMEETAFLDSSIVEQWYKEKDFHTMYIAEIETLFVAENE